MDEHEMVDADLTHRHKVSRCAADVKAELDLVARLISGLRVGSRSSHATSARDFPSGRIPAGRTGYSEYPRYYSSPNTKHVDPSLQNGT